jgi:long-chain acyl-CoA synthetase
MARALPLVKGLLYPLLRRREIGRLPSGISAIGFPALAKTAQGLRTVERAPHDLAVLQYTGGTTGIPKGAMLSHANLLANSRQMAVHDRSCPPEAERVMAVLPMFHVFALTTVLNYSVLTAAEMVLLPRFEVKSFLAAMRRTRPERLFVVPTILGALNALDAKQLPPMTQLRLCVSGGAPLPAEVRAAFEARTGVRVLEGYGLSEASPIITCNLAAAEIRDGSAGIAFPQTTIEIRSLADPASVAAPGERGEVCVRGPQVMLGYWQRPAETREVLEDGLLRTGDIGYLDADGYLFLTDRIKDVILCGGYNVYPRVIEDALYEHPDIADAAVIGVPDSYRGEAPKAFVTLRDGLTELPADLDAHLAERLSKIELPRQIEVRDALPKTLIGKFSKKDLRERESTQA